MLVWWLQLVTFFSRSHLVFIFSLKMRVSSKELFSTLKNLPGLDQSSFQLAKKLLSLTELHQRTQQRLTFLYRCKTNNIFPNFILRNTQYPGTSRRPLPSNASTTNTDGNYSRTTSVTLTNNCKQHNGPSTSRPAQRRPNYCNVSTTYLPQQLPPQDSYIKLP